MLTLLRAMSKPFSRIIEQSGSAPSRVTSFALSKISVQKIFVLKRTWAHSGRILPANEVVSKIGMPDVTRANARLTTECNFAYANRVERIINVDQEGVAHRCDAMESQRSPRRCPASIGPCQRPIPPRLSLGFPPTCTRSDRPVAIRRVFITSC